MGRPAQTFDRELFRRMHMQLSHEMQNKSVVSFRKASELSRKMGGSLLLRMTYGQLALLDEWLAGLERICRDVSQVQGEVFTPDFVREILLPEAMRLIAAREGSAKDEITRTATRTGRTGELHVAERLLTVEIRRVKERVANAYEIEARTLQHENAHKPKPQPPEPIRPVRTGTPLTKREAKLWELIRRGLKGIAYCREVDTEKISPPRKGVWKEGPRTYVGAYQSCSRLRAWIQSEKSKIRRKAELLGLARN